MLTGITLRTSLHLFVCVFLFSLASLPSSAFFLIFLVFVILLPPANAELFYRAAPQKHVSTSKCFFVVVYFHSRCSLFSIVFSTPLFLAYTSLFAFLRVCACVLCPVFSLFCRFFSFFVSIIFICLDLSPSGRLPTCFYTLVFAKSTRPFIHHEYYAFCLLSPLIFLFFLLSSAP